MFGADVLKRMTPGQRRRVSLLGVQSGLVGWHDAVRRTASNVRPLLTLI